MLPACAAEAIEHIAARIIALGDGDLADGVCHVLDRDADETIGDFFRRFTNSLRQLRERRADARLVKRTIACRPEQFRKMRGLELADHHVRVGHGERPAMGVAHGSGVRAGGVRSHLKARAVKVQDRAAACRHCVDRKHRCAQAHARDLGLVDALIRAVEARHVGRGAAHVEADDVFEAGGARRLRHSDHAASRPRDDRVLAAEEFRRRKTAIRCHEEKPRVAERACNAPRVARQDRRQISVDDGRIAARDEFDQRHAIVARRNLREARLARDRRRACLMRREAIAVQEDDGAGRHAVAARLGKGLLQRALVERAQNLALGGHALVRLDHAFVEHVGQFDPEREEFRPVLVADAKLVFEAARRDEHDPLATAGQQRVGCDRRAHAHFADAFGWNVGSGFDAQRAADAFERGIVIM